jgi:hypothetical protein
MYSMSSAALAAAAVVLSPGVVTLLGRDGQDAELRDADVAADGEAVVPEQGLAAPVQLLGDEVGEADADAVLRLVVAVAFAVMTVVAAARRR